jgi:hypothetical protein
MNDYSASYKEKRYRLLGKYSECGAGIGHGGELSNHGARYGMRRKNSLARTASTYPLRNRCPN